MAKKIYVLDTSVYLTDANSIYAYGSNDIIVPLKVLEEVDNHKKRQDSVGSNARHIIRILDSLREKGSLYKGIRIGKGKGILSAKAFDCSVFSSTYSQKEYEINLMKYLSICTLLLLLLSIYRTFLFL